MNKKRIAKRYGYTRPGYCEVGDKKPKAQILNISRSGIQFGLTEKLDTKGPYRVVWMDESFGAFDPTVLIAREFYKPENMEFKYFYGAQYCDLPDEIKTRLLNLLRHLRDENKKISPQGSPKITPQYLFDIIDREESFLKKLLLESNVPPYFENLIRDIKDYEKAAFNFDDEFSKCIQKLTIFNFHCNLFGLLILLVLEKPKYQIDFFNYVNSELKKITDFEKEVEEQTRKIIEEKKTDADGKSIQIKLNETSNRLFYTKQGLLQAIVETFGNVDSDSMEFREAFGNLREAHERIQELTNIGYDDSVSENLYDRRLKNPQEFTKEDDILDVSSSIGKKPNYLLWLGSFFILVFMFFFVVSKVFSHKDNSTAKNDLDLPIKIVGYLKQQTQIELRVKKEDWTSLSYAKKRELFGKVIGYIKGKKTVQLCIFFDEQGDILQVLYGTSDLNVLLPAENDPDKQEAKPVESSPDPATPTVQ